VRDQVIAVLPKSCEGRDGGIWINAVGVAFDAGNNRPVPRA
jgi:hypothetical protein